jgi:type I restriction enzyme S subunit
MKLDAFFEKFDQFADAPDAVAKMRKIVLQLAVRGKLVPQDPSEEPGDALLKRIRNAINLPLNGKSIKRQELAPLCKEDVPFPVPRSWAWTRLGEIGDWGSGSTPSRSDQSLYGGGITWLKSGELNDNQELESSEETLSDLGLKAGSFRKNKPGDVLLAMYGATLGKAAILAVHAVTNQAVCGCTPFHGVFNRYLFNYLISQRSNFCAASEGGAQPNISKVKIVTTPFPLPPLAEQERIVAKVDELLALCDRLEAQQNELKKLRTALTRAAVARFDKQPTPASLNFLFHSSYSVTPAELRKAILNLAVRGRLVRRSSEDGSSKDLVKHIAEERKVFRGKTYEPLGRDEFPFSIPSSWEWTRLGNIALRSNAGWSPQCDSIPRQKDEWGVLKVSAVSWGTFLPDENKALPFGVNPRQEYEVMTGDFLISRANTEELVARSVVVEEAAPHLMMSDKIVRFAFPTEIDPQFINLVNSAAFARDYYATNASGTSSSMKNVSREVICCLPIPLPPALEQRRIVGRVAKLFAELDRLSTMIASSHSLGSELLSSVIAEVVSIGVN